MADPQLTRLLCCFSSSEFHTRFKRNFWEKARKRDLDGKVTLSLFPYEFCLTTLLNKYSSLSH